MIKLFITLELLKNIIINPSKIFKKISDYDLIIYLFFCLSCIITLCKSFYIERNLFNFFDNEILNCILSFFNIPQVGWFIALLSFFLFIYLIGVLSNLFLKRYNKKELILCLLSISSIGIMMHVIFIVLHYFISNQTLILFRKVSFVWIIFLSIIAIKNSQKTSYMKSFFIFIISGLLPIIITGFAGFAPYLLHVVLN